LNEGKGTSSSGATELKTINPATEEVINRYKIITKEQINDKVKQSTNCI
jgi:acyl-CoA reductase-like NAD-dependent aldehyde dehydrogenase